MAQLFHQIDKALGPLQPNIRAQKTAPDAKHVFVFNADEPQGKSACLRCIMNGNFVVTALVKDADSPLADTFREKMIKVVQGSLQDGPSTYKDKLNGMFGVFIHVDFDDFKTKGCTTEETVKNEVRETIAAIDACAEAGVQQIVYSTLDETPEEIYIPGFDAKVQVAKYIKEKQIPSTFLYTSHAFDTVLEDPFTHHLDDGTWEMNFNVPNEIQVPCYPAEQTGEWVLKAFMKKKYLNADMHACTEHLSPAQICERLGEITGAEFKLKPLTKEQFHSEEHKRKLGEARWSHLRGYADGLVQRDVNHSETAVPIQWSFRQWANQSQAVKDRFGTPDKPKKKGHHFGLHGHGHGHGHGHKHKEDTTTSAGDTPGGTPGGSLHTSEIETAVKPPK